MPQLVVGHPELYFEALFDDRFVIACHKSHPPSKAKSTTWKDVKDEQFILLRSESGTRKILQRYLGAKYDVIANDMQVGHFHSQLGLVGKAIGIAAIPSLVRLSRKDLELATIPISNPTIRRKLGIVTFKGRSLSPAAEELRKVARTIMGGFKG